MDGCLELGRIHVGSWALGTLRIVICLIGLIVCLMLLYRMCSVGRSTRL